MFALEEQEQMDIHINLADYLASFWNSEAVQNIKAARADRERKNFMDDTEFEKSIKDKDYKENPLIRALQKIRENANNQVKEEERKPKMLKTPIDLDVLAGKSKI